MWLWKKGTALGEHLGLRGLLGGSMEVHLGPFHQPGGRRVDGCGLGVQWQSRIGATLGQPSPQQTV